MNAQDFSEMEGRKGNITLVLVWVCKWQGKLRRGLLISPSVSVDHPDITSKFLSNSQQTYNLPLASPTASAASLARNRTSSSIVKENVSDLLLVAINHPMSIIFDRQKLSITVPITLELRSASNEILICCIEAVDKRPLNSNNPGDNKLYNQALKGLRWEGKTKYIDLKIAPYESITLNFKAHISKAGVYNMKRFNITVSKFSETVKVPETYIKYLRGQSLLEVS
jgi:hypothetical protein